MKNQKYTTLQVLVRTTPALAPGNKNPPSTPDEPCGCILSASNGPGELENKSERDLRARASWKEEVANGAANEEPEKEGDCSNEEESNARPTAVTLQAAPKFERFVSCVPRGQGFRDLSGAGDALLKGTRQSSVQPERMKVRSRMNITRETEKK